MTDEISNRGLVDQFKAERLNVYIYADRPALGLAAAQFIGSELRRLLKQKERVAAIFASAPSQNETLAALAQEREIDWPRIIGFHLDEYLGMGQGAPQSFRRFLLERLINKVPMGEFNGLPSEATDAERACALYAEKLKQSAPDLALLGIGENGHLAFIDPPFCDFNDAATVKIVELDEPCRQQQVNEEAFASLSAVPRQALSLTIRTNEEVSIGETIADRRIGIIGFGRIGREFARLM